MTVRPPQNFSGSAMTDVLQAMFDHELRQERATELGRTGDKVASALARLRDAAPSLSAEQREDLLQDAADCVYAYFIQREISGFRSHRDAIDFLQIPQSILSRLGVVRPRRD